jgi:ribosomal protein S3AE
MAVRKKFIDVEIPLIDESMSVLGTPDSLKGRTIKLDLTRKLKGKSLEITFKILNQDEKLIGLPKKMQLMKFYIRRMMRKRVNYVEDSFITQAKDVKVIMKPFLITRKKVSRAVRTNLRKTTKEILMDYAKERTYLELCSEILSGELQKSMIPKLKKVYPLSFSDIRVFETKEFDKLEIQKPEKKVEETKEVEEKPKEKKTVTKKPSEKKAVKKETKVKATKKASSAKTKTSTKTKKE